MVDGIEKKGEKVTKVVKVGGDGIVNVAWEVITMGEIVVDVCKVNTLGGEELVAVGGVLVCGGCDDGISWGGNEENASRVGARA